MGSGVVYLEGVKAESMFVIDVDNKDTPLCICLRAQDVLMVHPLPRRQVQELRDVLVEWLEG